MKNIALMVLVLLCIVFTSCSAKVDTAIFGEWQGITPKQDLTFYENGNVEMKSPQHSTYKGTYKVKGNQLTCNFPSLSKPIECKASIRANKLILSFASGRKEEYKRAACGSRDQRGQV